MRSSEEIEKAKEFFKKQKTTLPEYSLFGDPNWEIIDKQLDVLDMKLSRNDIEDLERVADMDTSEIMNVYDWVRGADINIFEE